MIEEQKDHNRVRDLIFSFCSKACLEPQKESPNLLRDCALKPPIQEAKSSKADPRKANYVNLAGTKKENTISEVKDKSRGLRHYCKWWSYSPGVLEN
jgi:hypothetical protein